MKKISLELPYDAPTLRGAATFLLTVANSLTDAPISEPLHTGHNPSDVDVNGQPWNSEWHSRTQTKINGAWKMKRGVDAKTLRTHKDEQDEIPPFDARPPEPVKIDKTCTAAGSFENTVTQPAVDPVAALKSPVLNESFAKTDAPAAPMTFGQLAQKVITSGVDLSAALEKHGVQGGLPMLGTKPELIQVIHDEVFGGA